MMRIDAGSAIMILSVVAKVGAEGLQLTREFSALAQRVLDGDTITDQELIDAQAARQEACAGWDAAAGADR